LQQENELHVSQDVAITLAGIRKISGKAALEPMRGLIAMEAFGFCSLTNVASQAAHLSITLHKMVDRLKRS